MQGTALDQLGRHDEARRYYASALKIVPDEPSVLSNLGLSYVLSKDLPKAEEDAAPGLCQRRSRCAGAAESGLVVGLQGRFAEAEDHRQGRSAAGRGGGERRLSEADAEPQGQRAGRRRNGAGSTVPSFANVDSHNRLATEATVASRRSRTAASTTLICIAATLMPVGPRMTTNSTGRKNRIIGTVSFGGSAAAFFSASFMRMSRFSCAITRKALAERRAVAFRLLQGEADRLHALEPGALGEVFIGDLAVLQIGQFGRGQREFLGQRDRLRCRSPSLTLRNATSIDMPDSMQISSRSSASGNARLIES